MITCYIIDDEQPAIDILKTFIFRTESLSLLGESTDPVAGLLAVQQTPPALLFLDINMNKLSGLILAQQVPNTTQIIFCTAYSEFALESYELAALDFLMKPISFERFMRAIRRFGTQEIMPPTDERLLGDYIFVQTSVKGKMVRIQLDDIEYIEAKGNYIAILAAGKSILIYSTMRDIEAQLASNRFVRVHKSFIIPLDNISVVEKGFVRLIRSKKEILISRTYRDEFMRRINKNLLL